MKKPVFGLLLALIAVWTTGSAAASGYDIGQMSGPPIVCSGYLPLPPFAIIKPQYLGVGQPGRLPHKRVNAVSMGYACNISGVNVAWPQSLGVYFADAVPTLQNGRNKGLAGKGYIRPVRRSGLSARALERIYRATSPASLLPPQPRSLWGCTASRSGGGQIRTADLMVMSHPSYHCSTPLKSAYHTTFRVSIARTGERRFIQNPRETDSIQKA